MVYERYNKKEEVERMEKQIKQQRAKDERRNAKTQNSNTKFVSWLKKQKTGGDSYDRKVAKSERDEKRK